MSHTIYGPICKHANFFGGTKSLNVPNVKLLSKKIFNIFGLFMPFWWEWQFALHILSHFPGINDLTGLNDLNNLSDLNELMILILSKTFNLELKMYIFDGSLNFITWKRPLKVKILRKKHESVMFPKLNHRWRATLIEKNWLDRQKCGCLRNTLDLLY